MINVLLPSLWGLAARMIFHQGVKNDLVASEAAVLAATSLRRIHTLQSLLQASIVWERREKGPTTFTNAPFTKATMQLWSAPLLDND